MRSRPHAPAYYPGTRDRLKNWIDTLSKQGLPTELIESNVKLPPGSHGPPLPWVFSEIDFSTLINGCDVVTQQEIFGPALCITTIPMNDTKTGYEEFWKIVTDFCMISFLVPWQQLSSNILPILTKASLKTCDMEVLE